MAAPAPSIRRAAHTARAHFPGPGENEGMRFASPSNFRPVGADASTALRHLYRSDHLGALDDDDARQIQALGIRRVIDFRGVHERTAFACKLPEVKVHSLPIEPTIVQKLSELVAAGHRLTGDEIAGYMEDTYRGFVRTGTPRFAEFFGHLVASAEPTVFHCTAGKDRTGFAAALLLKTLGASDDEVMHDYLLTNERLAMPATTWQNIPREAMEVLWRVQPGFLRAGFDEVAVRYGSLDRYLREGLGVGDAERERLRAAWRGR